MPRKISKQVRSKAVGLYRSGMTMREISAEVGISYETVRRFVQEAGVTPSSSRQSHWLKCDPRQ